ncbi:MAG: hypothetical protein M1837_000455 [Sclerophora amabilis]|nr:MAG: hypothetical protein M1837_000455 [Sclerophora amabilis]
MAASGGPIDSRAPLVLSVTTALIVVSFFFVLLRVVSRLAVVRRFSLDDYFIILAWLIAFGLSFAICFGTSRGLGLHDVDIREEWRPALRRSEYAFSVLYNPALMATKTSILIFYLNLSKTQPMFRRASMITLVVVNAAGLALTLLNIFQCRPVGAVFGSKPQGSEKCLDILELYLSSSPVNIITDLAILFLPMPILTGIMLPRKQKTILVVTFGLGGFVAVVDVIRIAYLQQASLSRIRDQSDKSDVGSRIGGYGDFAWYASLSFMWTAVEVNVGIICACIPTLKPLFQRILPSILHDAPRGGDKRHASAAGSAHLEPDLTAIHRTQTSAEKVPSATSGVGETSNGGEMNMMDFLSAPEMRAPATCNNRPAHANGSLAQSVVRMDFLNLRGPKSMVKLTARESYFPLAMVTILFLLWGFAYGLLDVLNAQFQLVVQMSSGQTVGLHSAYWAGYFVAPLTFGRYVLKKWGFKSTFMTGLCIYGCGTLIFWPSAVLNSFPAFLVCNFIVGLGLSTLEVAANPFIVLCGPMKYAEIRSNFAQGFQATGTVLSPILARRVLFEQFLDAPSLIDVQWAYLGIAFFVFLLAVVFFYLQLPEASDADLEEIADRRRDVNRGEVGGFAVIFVTLTIGVFSQFCYVGGQEVVSITHGPYVDALRSGSHSLSAFDCQSLGRAMFAIGRFIAAFMGLYLRPRLILLFFFAGLITTTALTMNLDGKAGVAMIILIDFFEAPVWPMIFAISLRGLGSHTKTGAAFLTAAASGGAIFPSILRSVVDQRGIKFSLCVALALFTTGIVFPIYLNVVKPAQNQVDPDFEDQRPRWPRSWKSRAFPFSGMVTHKRTSIDLPTSQHIERTT